jgi:cysteine desulfuration protein SufE
MTLPTAAAEALQTFSQAKGWEQRARLLMSCGEQLEPLADDESSAANLVSGCESQVWLVGSQQNGRWQFRAASDARLIRGLLALLLLRVNGLSVAELAALDLPAWFTELGLSRHLSPSRSNGLQAVLTRMSEMARD